MAIYFTLSEKGDDDIKKVLDSKMDSEGIAKLYEILSNIPKYSKKLENVRLAYNKAIGLRHYSSNADAEGKYQTLEIDERYLKELIFKKYDGEISTLSGMAVWSRDMFHLGFKSKYANKNTVSTNKSVGRGKYGDTIGLLENFLKSDESDYKDYLEGWLIKKSNKDKINSIIDKDGVWLGPKLLYAIIDKKISKNDLKLNDTFLSFLNRESFNEFAEKYGKADADVKSTLYDTYIGRLSDDELNRLFTIVQTVNLASSTDYGRESYESVLSNITGDELNSDIFVDGIDELLPKKHNVKQGCYNIVNTIVKHVSKIKDVNRFLKEHGDLFVKDNGKLQLKDDVLYDIVDGEKRLKSIDDLLVVRGKLKEISYNARKNVYATDVNLKNYKRSQRNDDSDVI